MNAFLLLPQTYAVSILAGLLVSCGDATANQRTPNNDTAMTQSTLIENTPTRSGDKTEKKVVLPTPVIELPELPYDKSQLPGVLKLDDMITVAAHLQASHDVVHNQFNALKTEAQTSMNGTNADEIRGLLKIVDGFKVFEAEGAPIAQEARKVFMKSYADDSEFSSTYREAYYAAEEELSEVIGDHETRRAVNAQMNHTYRYGPSTNLSYLESMIEDSKNMRTQAIEKVISGVRTDLMVADYKKGIDLANLLQGSRNKLELVRTLDAENADIAAALVTIDEKAKSRAEDVQQGREAFRFPEPYTATNAPKNAKELEKALFAELKSRGYKVEKVSIASSWFAIRSVLGVHMYNQVDFHVAVESHLPEEAKDGVLDVLYVTGKTGGTKLEVPFASISLGTIGQMLKSNL